jgi:lipopolysaccharide transport system permease protein
MSTNVTTSTVSAGAPAVEIRPHRGWFDLQLELVWRYRELFRILVERDIKVRYRQAALGAAWAVIQPVFSVVVFTIIFGRFAKMPSDGVPYPLFAFAAQLPWMYFAEAARRGSVGLVTDAELVRKIYFPRLVIPLAAVTGPLLDFALAFVVLVVTLLVYGRTPNWHWLLLPVFLAVALLLALAVSLWLSPINVRFRDVTHTLPLLLQIWQYASPVIYPLSVVPARWRLLYSLNPMVGVIEGFRWALLGKAHPDLASMAMSCGVIALALVGGVVFFKRRERVFADVI